jgi:hypothetical protein
MSSESRFDTITPDELMVWMDGKKPFYLIHIPTNNHFQKVHLPGARNACVFEVTFLEQMNSISNTKNVAVVL